MTGFVSPLEPMIRRLEMHVALDDDDRMAIRALAATPRMFEPASYLVREGDKPTQCAILVTGYAYRRKLTSESERQILSLHIPGDILNLQHLCLNIADHSVQTLTRAE